MSLILSSGVMCEEDITDILVQLKFVCDLLKCPVNFREAILQNIYFKSNTEKSEFG